MSIGYNPFDEDFSIEEFQEYRTMAYSLREENLRLKKKIDELKEQRDVFKRLFESVNTSHFSTDSIIETMNSFYREQAEHLAELKIEQSVKDTAKEILQEIGSVRFEHNGVAEMIYAFKVVEKINELKKRYGVEVE